jgi:CRISPR-associated protein Cmr3
MMGRVGADGRTASLEICTSDALRIPDDLRADLLALGKGSLVRLTLATPAIFANGWYPGWLEKITDTNGTLHYRGKLPGSDLVLELVAAALERWQPYSGWSMEHGKMRAVRRMVPAGAVYWFRIVEETGEALAGMWMRPICDDEQDCRDGLGLALPGVGFYLSEVDKA